MECFNKLLEDFVAATRSGCVLEPKTETQKLVFSVLTQAAERRPLFEVNEIDEAEKCTNPNSCEVGLVGV